jgi:hypothetical protein
MMMIIYSEFPLLGKMFSCLRCRVVTMYVCEVMQVCVVCAYWSVDLLSATQKVCSSVLMKLLNGMIPRDAHHVHLLNTHTWLT